MSYSGKPFDAVDRRSEVAAINRQMRKNRDELNAFITQILNYDLPRRVSRALWLVP